MGGVGRDRPHHRRRPLRRRRRALGGYRHRLRGPRPEPGSDLELHAVNYWTPAIATHEANHPGANHYHAKIEELRPPDIAEPGAVALLSGGPECTHFSTARGGKSVNEQKRASAWHVLNWIEKLRPEHVLLENVPEFRQWGPIEDGTPTRDGSIFDRWTGMLEMLW
jgi:DNA (cytosine-5)-methyltransferase 1